MFKRILVRRLLPFIGQLIADSVLIRTDRDEVGTFIKVEINLLGNRIFNRRFYLAKDENDNLKPQQIKS